VTGAKIYPITLAAFGAFRLPVQGGYFKIRSSTGRVIVTGDTFGTLGSLDAGQGLRRPYNDLTLVDASGSTNAIEIIVASGDFIDDRITGEVAVIDGGLARTKAGDVYGARFNVAAVAAQYSMAQLWNSSTTKNLIVSRVRAVAGAAGVMVGIGTVQLATLVANSIRPKTGLGGATVFQGRSENAVGLVVSTITDQLFSGWAESHDAEPYVIAPGYGLNVFALDLNTALVAAAHLREDPIAT
jgi:hypothetical protein